MKKETINTFGEGLVMDLHPLTTPNNVLTNCLNGTIITYNGNEFVLQNDMGNGEVHTAYLDKGYVPVGMKEHGGIIYVATHNPITGKSQIGSFPSPQQLYEGEDLNVVPITFDFSKFITMKGAVPYIELEYFKQKLFQVKNSDEVKIFHPGDRFVIVCDSLNQEIRQAINDGVIKLRLGVINSSGNIDYINEDNLKTYSNGLWIYENTNTPMLDVIKSKELVQVFSAKSSGALILVVELKTFDTFNLIRKYSCSESNVISVEFSGETTGVYEGTSKKNPDTIGIMEENTATVLPTITKSGKTGKQSYKILPACPYGVLGRMAKSGTIDFDTIRTNSEVLGEWRFYVTDTYLKIGWGYDYYNLNEDSDIEKIEFTFISITESANARNAATLNGSYKYVISKEYYNGSFEEIIPFGSGILKNWAYIVRIDRYIGGVKKNIGYRLLYTGSHFNDKFEETPDFSTLPSGTNRVRETLKIKNSVSASIKPGMVTTEVKLNDAANFTPVSVVSPTDYLKEVPSLDTVVNYKYNTKKVGKYDVVVRPAADYDYDGRTYAGKPDPSLMNNFFGTSPSATFGTPDNTAIAYSSSSNLSSNISSIDTPAGSIKYDTASGEFKGTISTNRNIIANNGPVKSVVGNTEKLMPVYQTNLDVSERSKLFSFREEGDALFCVTGDEDYCCFNSRILYDAHTSGDNKGPKGGNGNDDGMNASLASMGDATIGIFGGHDGKEGRMSVEHAPYTDAAWHKTTKDSEHEIDGSDNFLIVTWKNKDKYHRPINLVSRKTEARDVSSDSTLIRVEKMLKCFLSQMLVAKRSSRTLNYVGPNSSDFVYHTAFNTTNTVKVSVNKAGQDVNVDFLLDGSNESIETHMSRWTAALSEIKNFLPIFKVHMPNDLEATITYGDNIRFDNDSNILNCYTSAYSYFSIPAAVKLTDSQRGRIYIGLPKSTNPISVNQDGTINLQTNSDGTYVTKSSGTSFVDWRGRNVALGYEINDRFITSYLFSKKTGEIPEGFYNEIYIQNERTEIGTWLSGKDSDAPDMAVNIGFGPKSIFKTDY